MGYDNFTNLYSLTKTLRFKLEPTDQTEYWLHQKKENGKSPIEIDQEIDRLYEEEMKPMFDKAHRIFITESLNRLELSEDLLTQYEETYLELKKLRKNYKDNAKKIQTLENQLDKTSQKLRKEVTQTFKETGQAWKERYPESNLKKSDHRILTEKESLDLLAILFPEKSDIIDVFKGFHTYFEGFNYNRSNYYSPEAQSTAIAYRIIDENLTRFIDNRQAFESLVNAIPELTSYQDSFRLSTYASYVTQYAIDEFNETIVGEINYQANLHSQQTKQKLPKLKPLYKQIGSEKKSVEITQITEGSEWDALQTLIDNQTSYVSHLRSRFEEFFNHPDQFDLHRIFFHKQAINTISQRWFAGGWFVLADILRKNNAFGGKKDDVTIKDISLSQLKTGLEQISDETVYSLFKEGYKGSSEAYKPLFVENDFWQTFLNIWRHDVLKQFDLTEEKISEFKTKSQKSFDKQQHQEWVKDFCDTFLQLERFMKDTKIKGEESGDPNFYEFIDQYLEESLVVPYYNAFRNYITQEPYSTDKIHLNFENGQLLEGWSDGQEKNKGGVLLQKNGTFYLGILSNRQLFRTDKENSIYSSTSHTIGMQRLILANLKFQTLAGKGFLSKYGESYGNMGQRDPQRAIQCLQTFIKENYVDKYPALSIVTEKEYTDKPSFDADIKQALQNAFVMKFTPINEEALYKAERDGEIYLFQIQTKDFTKSTSSNDDLQTLYWKAMFGEQNLQNPILALNGGADIFWRAGQKEKLHTRYDSNGKEVLQAKRYAEDTYLFHVPILINRDKPKRIKFKDKINTFLQDHADDITYLGIDRGEKHLIYYCLIDSNGDIIKQGSLNKVQVGENLVDFNQKLSERAESMLEARKNWTTIGKIKDLKEGYLSHVVHEIYNLMLDHQAVVVMEHLNSHFKAKRTAKVEKSIYKKFELALAKKLNYLVLKDKEPDEIGGVLHGYQLTPYIDEVSKFENAKQWGNIFYEDPRYTSTTDPATGWRKHKYVSSNDPVKKIQEFFGADGEINIFYDHNHQCYAFQYTEEKQTWTLHAHKDLVRFQWYPQAKEMKKHYLHAEFEELFADFDINQPINIQLTEADHFDWKRLAFLWKLLTQIRNTDRDAEGNENDFIQSPVYSEEIQDFFDSRKSDQYSISLPENGDANGAYHIALRGLERAKHI